MVLAVQPLHTLYFLQLFPRTQLAVASQYPVPLQLRVMGGYYFECHLYFNGKIRMEFEVVVNERVLCELMVLLEDKKEVVLKKLFIVLQYLSCIFKHLL